MQAPTLLITMVFAILIPSSGFSFDQDPEFFEAKIRPVLIEHCYECHNSHDVQEGGLALDYRQGLLDGGVSGAAIVPGDSNKSLLLQTLRHEIEGIEMPQGADPLPANVIADFKKWIEDGAVDPRDDPPSQEQLAENLSWDQLFEKRKTWWSFQQPRQVDPPHIESERWSGNPIDQFVKAKLDQEGFEPVARATNEVLIRRLFIQLLGLPPTVAESTQWQDRLNGLSDEQRKPVWEQLVAELLNRPEFGERWGRHWMDWIRFAESHGSEGDPDIVGASEYRDHLIRSLNADVSMKQMIIEHIAGDLLEKPRINEQLQLNESLIATAHWRMVFHGFAPTDAYEEKVRFIDDQINAVSKGFLGLTVSCARCHDHKFDAISQADYYALFGVLESCRPGRSVADTIAIQAKHDGELRKLKQQIRAAASNEWRNSLSQLSQRLGEIEPTTEALLATDSALLTPVVIGAHSDADAESGKMMKEWAARVLNHHQIWLAQHEKYSSDEEIRYWDLAQPNALEEWYATGQGLKQGVSPAGDFAISIGDEEAIEEVFPTGVFSNRVSTLHPARLASNDFTVDDNQSIWLLVEGGGNSSSRYVVRDYPRNGTVYPVDRMNHSWQWKKYEVGYWNGDSMHLELATAMDGPLLVDNSARSWFGIREALVMASDNEQPVASVEHLLPIVSVLESSESLEASQIVGVYEEALRKAIDAWEDDSIGNSQALFLNAAIRTGILPNKLAMMSETAALVEQYRDLEKEIPVPRRVPGLDESEPINQQLMYRGDHRELRDEIPRRFLSAVDRTPFSNADSGRMELANHFVSDSNPFTRRVMVNRVWHHLFGQGLVRTPDNFGRLGDRPSHPELLDWLANDFAENDWSLKSLITTIVTSETWQLSSETSADSKNRDPENRWLSHANVRRMEAEAIRDSLLYISGQLVNEMSGPSTGANSNRRSVYIKVKRNALDPFLRTFDFPEPFSTVGRRNITNVPAQSLTLMNDPFVERLAKAWASATLQDARLSSDEERIQQMWQAAYGRHMTSDEKKRTLSFLERYRKLAEQQRMLREMRSEKVAELDQEIEQLLSPTREKLESELAGKNETNSGDIPNPLVSWNFADADKIRANPHGELKDGAAIRGGGLSLDGRGFFVSEPIPQDVSEKTLEAWVQLKTLDQRGGGVISIQTLDGAVFDSIVFAEQEEKRWLAGSNFFERTKSFQGPAELEANTEPVQIVITYSKDGEITAYRNGVPYGTNYRSSGPVKYKNGEAVVTIGLRHLPGGGNRLLAGTVFGASVYDRALSADEVEATFRFKNRLVRDADVIAALTSDEHKKYKQLTREREAILQSIDELGPEISSPTETELFAELARAIFLTQEFIYVR